MNEGEAKYVIIYADDNTLHMVKVVCMSTF